MAALTTLCPVFFMLILGYIARVKGWIKEEEKQGANKIVFTILFPILVLKMMCSAELEAAHIKMIIYVFIIYMLAMIIGKAFSRWTGKEYAHFSSYLLTTNEGGNVALPLYLSIVGTSTNTVIFDISGTITCFVVVPILIAKQTAQATSVKGMLKQIFTNSFVIMVIIGCVLNFTGIYSAVLTTPFGEVVTGILDQATTPIVSMILFLIGYDFKVDKTILKPLLRLMSVKFIYYALVIAGFFVLFPEQMSDKTFMMAPIIYFMCPTGFGLMPLIAPLYKKEEDGQFTSAFVSMYMIITLIVYACVVIFIA